MKPFLLISGALWIVICLGSFAGPEIKWLVTDESRLEISGRSNVNEFQCLNLSYAGNDTLYEERKASLKGYFLNGMISLDVERFDCHHKLITNDFKRTLNSDQYPVIKVQFLDLRIENINAARMESAKGKVEITIGGVSRSYEMVGHFSNLGKGKAQLKGEKTVSLSDFGLEPRPKMLGMIKVDDSVDVNFNLIIKSL